LNYHGKALTLEENWGTVVDLITCLAHQPIKKKLMLSALEVKLERPSNRASHSSDKFCYLLPHSMTKNVDEATLSFCSISDISELSAFVFWHGYCE